MISGLSLKMNPKDLLFKKDFTVTMMTEGHLVKH